MITTSLTSKWVCPVCMKPMELVESETIETGQGTMYKHSLECMTCPEVIGVDIFYATNESPLK